VVLTVFRRLGGDALRVSRDLQDVLRQARSAAPPGMDIGIAHDQSDLIRTSLANVRDAMLVGALFAALILLAFLRSLRAVFIALAAMAATLLISFLFLRATGDSLNLMSDAQVLKLRIFGAEILAEGHIHRSLGQRPRDTGGHPLFGRRPYSPCCVGQGEYGLRPNRPDDTVPLGRCPRLRWEQAFGQTRPDRRIRNFEARKRGRAVIPSLARRASVPSQTERKTARQPFGTRNPAQNTLYPAARRRRWRQGKGWDVGPLRF